MILIHLIPLPQIPSLFIYAWLRILTSTHNSLLSFFFTESDQAYKSLNTH